MSQSLNASISMAENVMLNSVGGQNAALFDSVGDREGVRRVAVVEDMGHHAIVELMDNGDELFGATELGHDLPEAIPTDRVERLGQVNEGDVEVLVPLNALLLQLAGGKDHVKRSSTSAEAALALREEVLLQVK